MKHSITCFKDSFREVKKPTSLTATAMLTELAVVLGFYAIQLTPAIKISFAFLANELTALLFGPVMGAMMGGIADILKFIVKPTGAFFPGFTLNAILAGVIYGMILYKKPVRLSRIIIAKAITAILIDLFLTSLWINIMYGTPYIAILTTRITKELIMFPIEVALFYSSAKLLEKTKVFQMIRIEKNQI